jgi:hypothetical protein
MFPPLLLPLIGLAAFRNIWAWAERVTRNSRAIAARNHIAIGLRIESENTVGRKMIGKQIVRVQAFKANQSLERCAVLPSPGDEVASAVPLVLDLHRLAAQAGDVAETQTARAYVAVVALWVNRLPFMSSPER